MPLQTQNFMQMGIHKPDLSNLTNLSGLIAKGYENAQLPERLEAEQLARILQNRIYGNTAERGEIENQYLPEEKRLGVEGLHLGNIHKGLENQYYGRDKEAHIAESIARAQHYRDIGSGKTFAPSALGKLIQERDDLAAQDPNNPLLEEYDRVIKAQGGGKQYAPSALGKLANELQQVQEGFMPGSNGTVPLSPIQQDELTNYYKMQIQKGSSDSATRTTALRGQNLLKSIDASNIDDLTRYSGPGGAAKLKWEQSKDLTGNASEEYLKHLEAVQAAKLEAKELRQFFGDSITPEVQDAIYAMVNATSLTKSPEAAKRMIQKSRDTIKKQIKTFENGLKNTEAYTTPEPHEVLGSELYNGVTGASEKMIKVKYKGKLKLVPASKLQAALAAGGVYAGE
jgi:hypothetical protein